MLLMNIFVMIGTIAFAVSGALVGIQKHLDIFGVSFLSVTTAVGGGILRDLLIGTIPPVAFVEPIYCIVSIVSAILTYLFYYKMMRLKNIILLSDAAGLGVFTAIGSNAAFSHNMNGPLVVIFMGLFTGIGGGILRDVFSQEIPFVFKKEIYAVASILGALGLFISHRYLNGILPLYICFIITFAVRMFSIKYSLNLPVLNIESGSSAGHKSL